MRKEQQKDNIISPKYPYKPIWTQKDLSKMLGTNLDELTCIADNANKLYISLAPKPKPDGTFRYLVDAKPPLKAIQEKIKSKILSNVYYPGYLQGGISDKKNTRNCAQNAQIHTDSKVLIKEDISKFFPTVSNEIIYEIWNVFFEFSDEVSQLLTKLTTKDGFLLEGAKTSAHLSNLVFFDIEPTLYNWLNENGLRYSRYYDDITISSRTFVDDTLKREVISRVYNMMSDKGVKPNREKHVILSSQKQMSVNKLVINSGVPTLSKEDKNKIRAAVRECELRSKEKHDQEYKKLYNSTRGRVYWLRRFHPVLAKKYLARLDKI